MRRAGISAGSVAALVALAVFVSGCQVLTWRGPNGERLSRYSFGANTSIASLALETGTNGVRRVEIQGYRNDSTEALGTVTEAAVRAAVEGAR